MERIDGRDLIERSVLKTYRRKEENGWNRRHTDAFSAVPSWAGDTRQEYGMIQMIRGWAEYADAHFHRFETVIGEDYFLGPLWLEIGKSLRGLLNGELGRLDGGTLDGLLLEIIEHNGYTEEDL